MSAEAEALVTPTLPPGKTYDEALLRACYARESIRARNDDEFLDRLTDFCTRLCGNNRKAGAALAQQAIWTPELPGARRAA